MGERADEPATVTATARSRSGVAPRPYLLVIARESAWTVPLPDAGELTIGREQDCLLRFIEARVSRHHAVIKVDGGGARLHDLGSHNGTSVNGRPITAPHRLAPGDHIEVGSVTVIYVGAGAPAVADAANEPIQELTLGDRSVIVADPAMARLYALIEKLAASELPVLIQGETGVGKELAALAVHHRSKRRGGPFVALNCAAMPETLLESELFGYAKGAFTGAVGTKQGQLEAASGGTLFLDEVGELTLTAQAKLLRVVDTKRVMRVGDVRERQVDLRIVTATNRDLAAEVAEGRFREDLFYRLAGAKLWLPPLRDRRRELPLLAARFLAAACPDRSPPQITSQAMRRLSDYAWPGNVRELKNVMELLAATVSEPAIDVMHLPAELDATGPIPSTPPAAFRAIDLEVRELERSRMAAALAATDGNRSRAAELIGMPRRTFVTKLKLYGLR